MFDICLSGQVYIKLIYWLNIKHLKLINFKMYFGLDFLHCLLIKLFVRMRLSNFIEET